jgi:hypothetical protein
MKTQFCLCLSLICILGMTQAQSWHHLGAGLNAPVYTIHIHGDDVYAGGYFRNAGGDPDADYVARWDGCEWHAVAPGLTGPVYSIAILGEDVYVAGNFQDVGGNPNIDVIAFWDGNQWNSLGKGVDYSIPGLITMENDLYVVGDFGSADGVPNTAMIARWDGSSWHALASEPTWFAYDFTYISDIAIHDGELYVVGLFRDMGGVANADRVAKWDGQKWYGFGEGIEYGWLWSDCLNVAVDENNIFVSGAFTDAGGNPDADYIVRWDGNTWTGLSTHLSDSIASVMTVREGFLYCRRQQNRIDRLDPVTGEWIFYMTLPERSGLVFGETDRYLFGDFDEINGKFFNNVARFGGPVDCSSTDVTEGLEDSNMCHVYPNPARDALYCQFDSEQSYGNISLTNASGQRMSFTLAHGESIDIASLPTGLYFIEIRTDAFVKTGRFIKL